MKQSCLLPGVIPQPTVVWCRHRLWAILSRRRKQNQTTVLWKAIQQWMFLAFIPPPPSLGAWNRNRLWPATSGSTRTRSCGDLFRSHEPHPLARPFHVPRVQSDRLCAGRRWVSYVSSEKSGPPPLWCFICALIIGAVVSHYRIYS